MNTKIAFFIILTSFLIIFSSCDNVTDPNWIPDNIDDGDYELVWAEEFNQQSTILDSSKWNYDLGYGQDGWGNDEWQLYTNNPENVRVEDDNLIISAIWDSINYTSPGKRDGSITSARINTKNKFSIKYGKIKARIKPAKGAGMWPAFWMMGANFDAIGWPECGEIDIMEMSPLYHDDKTTMCTIHWWDENDEVTQSYGTTKKFNYSLADDYHIFEVEWDEHRIIGKIDNITYFVKLINPETMSEFFNKFFILLNVAVGGSLGGPPDNTTPWPQHMYIDWIRAYQSKNGSEQVETFGIFTDETQVDDSLLIGVDSEIYVWENTLTAANIPPYEGENVIAWATAGQAWFGGGIQSNSPLDLSTFSEGFLKFIIKIPASVTFKIGMNDIYGNENYVEFPANQTTYGLERTGEWEKATVPIADIGENLDLELLSYEFIILGEDGSQCQFALDDIYLEGGGTLPSSVEFDSETYSINDSIAFISVLDEAIVDSTISVLVNNSSETINIDVDLNAEGSGTAALNFGPTNDETNTIEITEGDTLSAIYTNVSGFLKKDTATITGAAPSGTAGIYSESHTDPLLPYDQIVNSADWSGNGASPDVESTAVTPIEGSFVLGVEFIDLSGSWGGIAFDYSSTTPDITAYNELIFYINSVSMPTMKKLGVKFEDNQGGNTELNIADYTPEYIGQWAKYKIPLADFTSVDFTQLKYFLLVNPSNNSNNFLFGNLYFDDIYLRE
ncbi:MAG: glycoside hydrolase family 16 protein [Candidatus Cloacimonetes bacterium]|nr:glycoside hydrolase family 16 protein [Candidatus Cloacimonadota bacterium]